jgi:TolB-like protein
VDGEICECFIECPDGFEDLTLKFDKQEIIETLGSFDVGDEIVLTLTGHLKDGTPIEGQDCVVIVGEKKDGEPLITFERTYGGDAADEGYSVNQTKDGGYIIAGQTRSSFGAGGWDIYLIKTDSLGDTLWTRTYGGSSTEEQTANEQSIQQTSDGGYIITGAIRYTGLSLNDVLLIKTDSLGNTLWTQTYGGPADDLGFAVLETTDGGYIIVGEKGGPGNSDLYLIKTNASGNPIWTKTYGGPIRDVASSIQKTSDGGYIITGWTRSFGTGVQDIWLLKTDSLGDTLWTKTYGGLASDEGYSVQISSDCGYIISGVTFSFGAGSGDVWLLKTDASGDTLWTKIYGGLGDDRGFSVQQTNDGGYVTSGFTNSFGSGGYDFYLLKTDSSGDTLWTRTFGGTSDERSDCVRQTSDGGFIIAGYQGNIASGSISNDVYLIKTDENGLVEGGISGGPQSGGIITLNPPAFNLNQNHPNPFNKLTAISYQLRVPGHTTLKIYDLSGRLVETLVNEAQKPGVYQVEWDGKDHSSGIYFYRLSAGENVITIKMILLR